jgi:2-methylcitrate dehydratase PrpD
MSFNLALGILEGWSEIPDYAPSRTQESALRAIMEKVRHVADPADGSVDITIVTKDGRRLSKNVKHAPGDPTYGLQEERTLKKYRACAAYRLPAHRISAVEHDLLNLETVPNMARIMDALTDVSKEVVDTMPA